MTTKRYKNEKICNKKITTVCIKNNKRCIYSVSWISLFLFQILYLIITCCRMSVQFSLSQIFRQITKLLNSIFYHFWLYTSSWFSLYNEIVFLIDNFSCHMYIRGHYVRFYLLLLIPTYNSIGILLQNIKNLPHEN